MEAVVKLGLFSSFFINTKIANILNFMCVYRKPKPVFLKKHSKCNVTYKTQLSLILWKLYPEKWAQLIVRYFTKDELETINVS